MDYSTLDNEALSAALTEARTKATALFALTEPSVKQVGEAEALLASIAAIETEQATRAAQVADAAARFAAARATFNSGDAVEDAEVDTEEEADEAEPEAEPEADETEEEADEAEPEADAEALTAAARGAQRVSVNSAAKRVGSRSKRPNVASKTPITITAAADVQGFSTGQALSDMDQVTKALMNRVKGFAPFNARAGKQASQRSGGEPVLSKFGVASFGVEYDKSLQVVGNSGDLSAVKAAIKGRVGAEGALTAAGWCAPSETIYSFIADYVVDGLVTVPEVSAPRGGLMLTTGPAKSSQGAALDDFGFTQTEAQAEAGQEKTCEVIECPDFVDHRLDAIGYCYKIPLLTQKAYPELITDALRFANVLYAHKVNARIIARMESLSTPVNATPYGATFTDTLEALAIIAVKERRRWNLGANAVMEVKLPEFAREVFRADMSRRQAVAVDAITNQQIDAHFVARNLVVEYVSDWQEMTGANPVFPANFKAMIFPAGTFIKAVEDVINLSAVYDAASLSVNEYTGVFFEQGILVAQAGYGSTVVTVPICTAGMTGAAILSCGVDETP